MLAYIARRLCVGAVISSALLCNSAFAVLIRSGNGNTTAPADDPGFANVGKSASGNASVTYLGNRWVITAGHVSTGSTVSFDPDQNGIFTTFNIDASTVINPFAGADLQLFRLTTDPGLPALNIATAGPDVGDTVNPLILIGNGLDRGNQHFWNALWQDVAPPGLRSGFEEVGGHNIRWGENVASHINQNDIGFAYYKTSFDDAAYTEAGFTDEAQATNGDSGGGVFQKIGGQWYLSGIIFDREYPIANQPAGTTAFGNLSRIVDLSVYRSQILAIAVPEPASLGLALLGAAGLLLLARRRK
jgi:hypothetical protein